MFHVVTNTYKLRLPRNNHHKTQRKENCLDEPMGFLAQSKLNFIRFIIPKLLMGQSFLFNASFYSDITLLDLGRF